MASNGIGEPIRKEVYLTVKGIIRIIHTVDIFDYDQNDNMNIMPTFYFYLATAK